MATHSPTVHRASFPRLLALLASLAFGAHGLAFDWESARKNLGTVEVKDTSLSPIVPGGGDPKDLWLDVPSLLLESKAMAYMPKVYNFNISDYRVTKGGWIFFAGFFAWEGGNGPWQTGRKDEVQLQADGWTLISSAEMGGALMATPKREYKIFAKQLPEGTAGKFHINKYRAPRFLSFAEIPPASFAALPKEAPALPTLPPKSDNATRATPPPKATPAPTTAQASATAADLVKTHRSNLVFVTMEGGSGSGFIASYGNGTYLITNAHVTAGAKGAVFKTLDGAQVQTGAPAVAVGHDIFLMALKQGGNPLPVMTGVDEHAAIGDQVVVLGNAEGAGVINTITGKIVGLGPNLVEVDAPFQPGNSGSPIIHLKTGKVIGVATYAIIRKYDPATKEAVKEPVVRRFGYRLDSVKKWEPVNWQTFNAQAAGVESIEKLTEDLVSFLQDLSKDGRVNRGAHSNPVIKTRIDQWLDSKSRRLSARDNSNADQSFLSFLKITCQSDITAALQQPSYDYFRRQLEDQQKERTEIAGIFSKIIESIRQER